MKLYEFSEAIDTLFVDIAGETDDGELTEEHSAQIDELFGAFKEKVERCAAFIKQLEAQADASKTEADRLSTRARVLRNKADGMKGYVLDCMESVGEQKVVGDLFTVARQSGPASVAVVDESALPEDCVQVTTERRAIKAEIKQRLTAGEDVPGAELRPGKTFLRIR